ncbi:MAG: PAS-domain containing protein [Rhodomicrobium sp.]|nr:PAS-domain containing protein [Rhodomicrobium sp.]
MKASRKSSRSAPAAAGFALALPFLAATPAEASEGWFTFPCAFAGPDSLLIGAGLIGAAAASAILAFIFREKARALAKQSLRHLARLDALSTVEANFRALVSLEPQACVIWSDGHPRLALHTLQSTLGVPTKLPQILRFGSWLHPDDAGRTAESLTRLQKRGEAFISNASTLEGHVIEVAGAVAGAETILRIRPFSPVNKELVRLIGENKRLKQSLHDRERLLDSLPVPVWLRDAKGALSWVNSAYLSAINANTREETLEKQIELFETRQRSELHRLSHAKKPGRVKLQTVVNGGVQIYEAIATPLERGSGGAAFDVAPLAIAQDELDRQMEAHSRTLDKVSTGVAVFGADRKLVYGNDAFARIWALDEAWLKQGPAAAEFFDLLRQRRLLPEQPDYRKWRDSRLLAWDNSRTLDELWHRPDGRTVHVVTDCRNDGGITFLFDDVTEKLSLERQYHSLIEGQRETLDHLSEGLAVFGADGRLQLFNPAFQTIWKLPEAVLLDCPHLESIIVQSERLAPDLSFWQTLRDAITGMPEARDTFSGTIGRQDDTRLAYTVTPLPDGGTLVTFADVTDSKRFEDVLLERNEALEASDRLKTAFLSHVSYELRTPLTTIIGFADLLAEPSTGPLNGKQREYLNDIKTSSQVLLNIINDILDLAVIDAGALDLKLSPVDLNQTIEAAALGVRERLSRARISLDVHVAKDAGTAMADENRLIQVLYNLLSNAIGFSPEEGTITLTCRSEKNGIAISVQDTGLGIPEEEQAAVFERFETRSNGSRHRGAGLGLSLVKSIVELHKGRIDLRSTPGAGTTVTITLPHRHPALQQKPSPAAKTGVAISA